MSRRAAVPPARRGAVLAVPALALLFLAGAAAMATARADGPAVRLLPSDPPDVLAAKAASVLPTPRQLRWQAREFQAFVHFGTNTFTDREWGLGTEDPKVFDPADFDARQWVAAFRAAGMRGVVLTAKHHDGLCLWPSRFTEHSVRNSPWRGGRGDVVREVADACREAGLAFGVYLSPWDRHEPSYGDSPRYDEHFKNQLRELLTQYGTISEVWFDGACGEGPNGKRQVYDWDGYWRLVRELQPDAAISVMGPDARWIGNEAGVARASEWSVIPVEAADDAPSAESPGGIARLDATAADLGSRERLAAVAKAGGRLLWYPGQVDVSIRPGWFHHAAEDARVRSLENLLDIYYTSVGGNAQLLLNVPPDRRGRLHENDVLALRRLGDALRATFDVDRTAGATVSREGPPARDSAPGVVLDRDPATSIGLAPSETGGIVLDLPSPTPFNVALVQEDIAAAGQRVEAFALDAWTGTAWSEIARGTTVGWKRLLRFPTVTAARVRLRVLAAREVPAIAELGLYLDPARRDARPELAPVPDETDLKDFTIELSGHRWNFHPDPPREWWRPDADLSDWEDVDVPGEWSAAGRRLLPDKERACVLLAEIAPEFAGRRVLLRFDGVYSDARVWVNGTFVRDHFGGFTSWQADVTGLVTPGERARIAVGVTDRSDDLSWGSAYAKHSLGGILREAKIVALPAVHAARLRVSGRLDAAYREGTLEVTADVRRPGGETAELRLALKDPAGRPVPLAPDAIRFEGAEGERTAAIPAGPVLSWDAEHPRLYELEARLVSGGRTLEVFRRRVGFRTVEVRGNALLVNGRPVKLRGGNRHDVDPLTGRSIPATLDDLDAKLFRDANLNFVRTSHYPPRETFLEACDRYGLYVEEENALCFVATHGNRPTQDDPAYRARYLGQFAEMIERDRDHPSVILWSLGNESRWGENVRQLHDYAKAEDPSRPVIWSYPDTVPKGVAGYDVYSSHYPAFDGDLTSAAIPRLYDEWAHVACYDTDTLLRDPGVRDFWGGSIRKFWDNAFASDGCLGGAIWGLVDDVFFLPQGACGYGEWGIVDGWRRPKPEYWHVKKAYSPVRVSEDPLPVPKPGTPLRLAVRNRHDHTDLAELKVTWSAGADRGELPGPAVPPRGEGALVVPGRAWKAGDLLRLTFARGDGLVLDEYAVPVGPPAPPMASEPKGPAPKVAEDAASVTIAGPGFEVVVDKATGRIARASRNGTVLLAGGPLPDVAPAKTMPWCLTGFEVRAEGNEAVVDVRGSFAGTLASFLLRVDGEGLVTVDYRLGGRPDGASELGLAFLLPKEADALTWERRALHGVYPEGHIGRPAGTAVKVRAGSTDGYRFEPLWAWPQDMAEWFLLGSDYDRAMTGATRDFRALRPGLRSARVGYGSAAESLEVEPVGSQAMRAEVLPDGQVRLNVVDAWAYPDLGWGNDTGAAKLPAEPRGRVRVRLAGPVPAQAPAAKEKD